MRWFWRLMCRVVDHDWRSRFVAQQDPLQYGTVTLCDRCGEEWK